jgi:hypothetical protein
MTIQPPVTFTEVFVNLSGSQIRGKSLFSVSEMQFIQGIMNCLHYDYFFEALPLGPGKGCESGMVNSVTDLLRLLSTMGQSQIKVKTPQIAFKTPLVSRSILATYVSYWPR